MSADDSSVHPTTGRVSKDWTMVAKMARAASLQSSRPSYAAAMYPDNRRQRLRRGWLAIYVVRPSFRGSEDRTLWLTGRSMRSTTCPMCPERPRRPDMGGGWTESVPDTLCLNRLYALTHRRSSRRPGPSSVLNGVRRSGAERLVPSHTTNLYPGNKPSMRNRPC